MDSQLVCSQADCAVAEDGECLEGHRVEDCPHIRRGTLDLPDPIDGPGDDEELATGPAAAAMVKLFLGAELDDAGAREIMGGSQARVIVIAGMPDAGKTTLLATLYELFHDSPVGGYLFAGSRTQHAFERRCHKSRTTSRRDTADTERTKKRAGVTFLHLAVRHESLERAIRHLLLTDISGETFRDDVRHSTAGASALPVLQRADHLVLLLDSEQLASPSGRQRAQTDARMILRSCVESGQVGSRTRVQVVFARWDRAGEGPKLATTEDYTSRVEDDFRRLFGTAVVDLSFHRLATRPDATSSLPRGYGLTALLQAWVEESAWDRKAVRSEPTPAPDDREVIRFRWRVGALSHPEGV